MELLDYCDKLGGATKLGHDLPQPLTADSVKGFSEIHEGGIETNILLPALLL